MALATIWPASGSSHPSRSPHAGEGFGQVQLLAGPFGRRVGIGLVRRGSGQQLGADRLQLFDRQDGGVFGEEGFHVAGQIPVEAADGVGDLLGVIDPEIDRFPSLCWSSASGRRGHGRDGPVWRPSRGTDRRCSSRTWVIDPAPSARNASDRSARSTSRHVNRSSCRPAPNTSGSTSVANSPDVSAETAAAASSAASACNCAAFAANPLRPCVRLCHRRA